MSLSFLVVWLYVNKFDFMRLIYVIGIFVL